MEEKRPFEMKFELKEIAGCLITQPICHVEFGDIKQQLYMKSPISLQSLELTPNTSLNLSLANYETIVGSTKISFGTFFGEGLQGKINKWLKFKSEEFPNLRVKIAASASKGEKQKVKKVRKAKNNLAQQSVEPHCPYLENLATGNTVTTQPLDDLWKNRNVEGQHSIKISLEPDSPSRTEENEFDFTPEQIESLTVDQLQKMSGSNIKKVLRVICEEAKHLEIIALSLPGKREELNSKVEQRRDLEKWSKTEICKLRETWAEKKEFYDKVQYDLSNKNQKLIEAKDSQRILEGEVSEKSMELLDLKREHVLLSTLTIHKSTLQDALKQKSELQAKVDKAKDDLKNSASKTSLELKQILDETEQVKAKIKSVDKEYKDSHDRNIELRQKINSLKAQLQQAHELKEKVSSSYNLYKTQEKCRQQLTEDLLKLAQSIKQQDIEITETTKKLLSDNKNIILELQNTEKKLELEDHKIHQLHKDTYESIAKKVSQEEICCIRADMSHLVEDLNSLNDFHKKSNQIILPDLDAGSKILMEESEKINFQAEKLDKMIEQVDEKEEELDNLKNAMGEVKKRAPPYVPANDPVDIALAEYLNSLESPVPIKFIRQEGGNYLFGSKKIYIKIESGRILIKVGGGFTSIEEFLSVYTKIEIEKAGSSPKTMSAMGNISQIGRQDSGLSPGRALNTESSNRSPRRN
ncbi:hypothetical protein SteCoe_25625 [Stentor coeruleus]|uniref:GAR domain-containing protein n=1 Tax=Stentor coeruleus TaxID=5963 RepID=A0A1R2BET2_9CILI|nr:hypothetical protein SteCoe_25625 [Stentor coeruleus]